MRSSERELIPIDTGRRSPYLLEISRYDVPMRGLPEELHGITVAHLSDLHGGYGNTEPVHEVAVARVEAERPELILLTGDYIDDHESIQSYPIDAVLKRLSAPLGAFACFGNHDHRRGVVGTRRYLEASGIQVLCNENRRVGPGLWIAGVDDLFEGQPDMKATLAGIPENVTAFVLSHNPNFPRRAPDRDALVLSGHTHGAQIALPLPTPKMVCWGHLRCQEVAGWYRRGGYRLYVSRGIGVTGRPYRYRCPAELIFFRLLPSDV